MIPKNRDYDKRIFRLLSILNKLDGGEKVSSRQLAEDFNVTLRTIQRDLEILNRAGFLIASSQKGIYSFEEGFSLKKMKLSSEEASLLTFICEISQSLGTKFESSFRNILRKVIQQEYDSPFYAKMPEGMKLDKTLPFVEDLESAIDEYQKIEVEYLTVEGKSKHFNLDPLKIIFFDGFWYLLGRVSDKDLILKLRLERIKQVNTLEDYFEPPENLKTMLDQSVNIWFTQERDKKIVFKVDKETAEFFKEKIYFPLQKVIKVNKDGSLLIEAKASRYEEVLSIIMHWIPHVVVVSPVELKTLVKTTVDRYRKLLEAK